VVRALAMNDAVAGIALVALLHELLEQGLVVFFVAVLQHLVDLGDQKTAYEGSDGLEPRIQVVSPDDGLHGIGDQGLLRPASGILLTLADQHEIVYPQVPADLCQAVLAHHVGLDLGHVAFAFFVQRSHQIFADHQPQNRVPEKLELLIVVHSVGLLVCVGTMGKSKVQEREALEPYLRVFLKKLQLLLTFPARHRSCEGQTLQG
jgi:hypothetical protein